MSGKALKSALLARSSRIFSMAAKVAGHELTHKVKKGLTSSADKVLRAEIRTRVAQATVIADNLSQLKGAVMKAGQLLSIDAGDVLPPEATEVLSRLQGAAEPMDFAVIEAVLRGELGDERLARLDPLDPVPAACASIGQVHRAEVDGRRVAVKVQYPGVAESIDSDMMLLEKLAGSWLTLTGSKIDLAGTFEELRDILHLEADYERELALQLEYRRRIAGDGRFVVPEPIAALSSRRVLTMTWEEGMALRDWVASQPSRPAREAFARAILELYCKEFFEWGLVQTDPNFGNFLIRPGGEGHTPRPADARVAPTIVLLDFGATLRYDDAFRRQYVALLRTVASGRRQAMIDAGIELQLLDPREPEQARELFADMLVSAMEPFALEVQPFVFRDADYAARSTDIVTRFTKSLKYSPPPRRLLFLHRKLGGIFQLLKRLDVTLDLIPYWRRMVAEDVVPRAA